MAENSYTVISYYKFFEIKNIFNFKNRLMKSFNDVNVKGIILIAPEGININISILTSEYIQIMN